MPNQSVWDRITRIDTRILVVQHAEKEPKGGDPGLTARGRYQARAVADALATVDVVALYSSPLRRAVETAELIGRRLGTPVAVDPRLVERANWNGENQSLEQFLAEWARSGLDRDFTPSSGDSSRAAGRRMAAALAEFAERHPEGTVVVVSHGGVTVDMARNLVGDEGVAGLAPDVIETGVGPCAITELVASGGGLELAGIGQVGWRSVSWLAEPTVDQLRVTLGQLVPALAQGSVTVSPWVAAQPRWRKATAVVDGSHVVKFAWSQPAAQRVAHEAAVLEVLARTSLAACVPEVVASSNSPALLVTRLVDGRPLTIGEASGLDPASRGQLAADLGRFLAQLHDLPVSNAILAAGIATEHPRPQGDTAVLRARLPDWIVPAQAERLSRWCDFADEVLANGGQEQVLLHGDFHGYNIVLAPGQSRVRLVADFETAGLGDSAFDFRYLPGQVASTPALFMDVAAEYHRFTGRVVDVARVLAWHIRTVLGDALWRSEARVPLPDGRTPTQWMEDLADRMTILRDRIEPRYRRVLDS